MSFQLKSQQQILATMINEFKASTAGNDLNKGSVIATFLEAASAEDFNQMFQLLSIINNFSLDNVTGDDLDKRALEYGLDGRLQPSKATTTVTISDSAFTKISSKIYAGLAGPIKGQTVVYVGDASNFTSSGAIIIGRDTSNVETVSYSSIILGTSFDTINLSSGLAKDHGTDETVILSQGGDRVIGAGTLIKVPASDFNSDISFSLNIAATILDGETETTGIEVTAIEEGSSSNVPADSINSFSSKPFATAVVTNEEAVTNGRDLETDAQLRDRIKDTIQSLSRGTGKSLITGVVGIVDSDDNKRVVSANLIEPTDDNDLTKLVIDDGTGFEPSFEGIGYETLIEESTGGEEYIQLNMFPTVKAVAVTINSEPFAITNGMTLIYEVNGVEETVIFYSTDFRIIGAGTAQEVIIAINNRASLIEARTTSNGTKVEIRSRANVNEGIEITGGTANAISILNFPLGTSETLKLYKFNGNTLQALSKDGSTALLDSGSQQPFNFAAAPSYLDIQLDNETLFSSKTTLGGLNQVIDTKLISKFPNDNDLLYKYITFLSGTNIGLSAPIVSYNSILGIITIAGGLLVSLNDQYQIDDVERIYFSNVINVDFVNPAAVTVAEVMAVINSKLKGVASASSNNTKVRLISNVENSADSKIKVHGGTANAILNFSTTEVTGVNKDYTLNRFNGQIKLSQVLGVGESITAGTRLSRGFLISFYAQPYSLADGDTISIKIDGAAAQTITFNIADFSNISQASSAEIVAVINRSLEGGTSEVTSDNKILIHTNTFDANIGSIEISGVTGNAVSLGFTLETIVESITPHYASILSGNIGDFNFVEDDNLVVVLDNDSTNKTFDITMHLESTVVAATLAPTLSFTAKITSIDQNYINKFTVDNILTDMKIIFITASNAMNVNVERNILSYNASTGVIVLTVAMPSAITAGDTFILMPVTTKNVVDYLGNSATSTLYLYADIATADQGSKVQITTLTDGGSGYVNVTGGIANSLQSYLTINGSGMNLWVENALWKAGMNVTVSDDNSVSLNTYIVSVTADNPVVGTYRLTMANNVSAFTVDQNAQINRTYVLDFDTSIVMGVDAYKYYTGLLRRVQRTVDGLESDQSYPGLRAAGVQIEVIAPTVQKLRFEIDVTLNEGTSISTVIDDIKNAVSSYVNSAIVGEDIILNEIIKRIKGITGVSDLAIIYPAANVPIADGEIARVSDNDIIIG